MIDSYVKIKDVCKFVGGSQPPKSTFSSSLKDGYVRLLQIRDFKGDNFLTFIPKDSTRKFCEIDDIMIGRYGPPIFQVMRGLAGAYNVALLKAQPNDKVNKEYLYYYLKQDSIFDYVEKLSPRTGGQTGVDLIALYEYPFYFPAIEEQFKIASILSTLDQKIDLNNKINKELESIAKLIYDYWFVQFDFPTSAAYAASVGKPEMEGRPYKSSGGRMVWSEELKREIPEGWGVGKLGDVVAIVKEKYDPKTESIEVDYIGLEHIPRKSIVLDRWERSDKISSQKTRIQKRDILFGKIRPYFHKVGFSLVEGITSTDTIVMRVKEKILMPFILQAVFSDEFVEVAVSSSTGSKMPRADWSVMEGYLYPIPDTKITDKYFEIMNPILKKMEKAVLENQELSSLRDWLLPMLMNGQVRVGE